MSDHFVGEFLPGTRVDQFSVDEQDAAEGELLGEPAGLEHLPSSGVEQIFGPD